MPEIDYLLIGHVSKDLIGKGTRLGGTVSYSALMAKALSQQVGILTCATGEDMTILFKPLKLIPIHRASTETTTTLELDYTSAGRTIRIIDRADDLIPSDLPPDWRSAKIIHLAPIVNEVAPEFASTFSDSFLTATPQGWMREWNQSGEIRVSEWTKKSAILPHLNAVVISHEDVGGNTKTIQQIAKQTSVLVVTHGGDAIHLYIEGELQIISVKPIPVKDETGAGDIFATSFFVRYQETLDPIQAIGFAALLASDSVRRIGMNGIPNGAFIRDARKRY